VDSLIAEDYYEEAPCASMIAIPRAGGGGIQGATLILHAALSPQAIALHRLIVAESPRSSSCRWW